MTDDRDARKREAAMAAVAMVEDGMVVGLGTGSTATFAIEALIERVRDGLRIVGIPTSERSAAQAREGGIALTDFAHHTRLDLTIDGADEIAGNTLDLIKGLGGALLREKIVAAASERLVIIADEPKLVVRPWGDRGGAGRGRGIWLGDDARSAGEAGGPPGAADCRGRQCVPNRRRQSDPGLPFRCDQRSGRAGAYLVGRVGVVETGLFIGMATTALVATAGGIIRLDRAEPAATGGHEYLASRVTATAMHAAQRS